MFEIQCRWRKKYPYLVSNIQYIIMSDFLMPEVQQGIIRLVKLVSGEAP